MSAFTGIGIMVSVVVLGWVLIWLLIGANDIYEKVINYASASTIQKTVETQDVCIRDQEAEIAALREEIALLKSATPYRGPKGLVNIPVPNLSLSLPRFE